MAKKAGNMEIEDSFFWIDSDDSWDMVDDQPNCERDDLPICERDDLPVLEVVDPLEPYYPSSYSDMDYAETLEDSLSEMFSLPSERELVKSFLRKDLQSTWSFQDIVKEHVLPFLPAKSLCRFRTVCKEWDKWIVSPFFAHQQARVFQGISGIFCQIPYAYTSFTGLDGYVHGVPDPSLGFLPEPVVILASHNGLLCCRGEESCNYYVCNPGTKKWERLPNPNFHQGFKTAVGLALDVDMFNFKANFQIVCVIPQPDSEFVIFEIYSSRSNSWRHITDVCPELKDGNLIGNSLYNKGCIYWMVDSGFILVFDTKNEEFGIMKLLAGCGPSCALSSFGGELCSIEPWEDESGCHYIRIYGGMEMMLKSTVHLRISHIKCEEEESFRALGLANDNFILFLLGSKLIAYNMTEKVGCVLNPWALSYDFVRYLPYVNSLVEVCKPYSQIMHEEY